MFVSLVTSFSAPNLVNMPAYLKPRLVVTQVVPTTVAHTYLRYLLGTFASRVFLVNSANISLCLGTYLV